MKSAVDTLDRLLWQRENDPAAYLKILAFGERSTITWDDPELKMRTQSGSLTESRSP
jgi:hypothetical protein